MPGMPILLSSTDSDSLTLPSLSSLVSYQLGIPEGDLYPVIPRFFCSSTDPCLMPISTSLLTEAQYVIRGLLSWYSKTLGINGTLIILTLAVSISSYSSQRRGSIREAIEQLDPRWSRYRTVRTDTQYWNTTTVQLKPALNEFKYLEGKSELIIIANHLRGDNARVVQYHVPPYYLTLPEKSAQEYNPLGNRLENIDSVTAVERTDEGLILTCKTREPVKMRQIANQALNAIDDTVMNQVNLSDYNPAH